MVRLKLRVVSAQERSHWSLLMLKTRSFISLLVVLMVGLSACAYPSIELTTDTSSTSGGAIAADSAQPTPVNPATSSSLSSSEEAVLTAGWRGELTSLYEQVAPSIVGITASRRTGISRGTGFIIDGDGHIVTNHHVIDGTGEIHITMADGRWLTAIVIGQYPAADLAILKVHSEEPLPAALVLGDSELSRVGTVVLAVGNPLGLERSLSAGVLSGKGRVMVGQRSLSLRNMLQTDAAINSGNSGGPLLNLQGEVIGVITAVSGEAGSADRLGFAVPANTLKQLLPELLNTGTAQQAFLGVQAQDLNPETARSLGLSFVSGAVVTNVVAGSPAAEAGLRGLMFTRRLVDSSLVDVIVAVNDQAVRNMDDLLNLLDASRPGDQVDVTIRRGDERVVLPVVLGARPD